MYITKIRLNGVSDVDLPIVGALPSDTFLMKGADGLGPPEIVVTITNGVYQNSKPADRQIVIRVGLNANYGINQTSEQLRSTLYGLLSPGFNTPLKVEMMNGSLVVATVDGYISKIEPVIFAKDPEVQITINCVGSYLYAPNEVLVVPSAKSAFDVPNVGTAPVGFYLELEFTTSLSTFTLSRASNPDEFMTIDFNFVPADNLVIDTRKGSYAVSILNGAELIGYMDTYSTWMQLYSGVNSFITSNSGFNWVGINFTPQYWGI